MTLLKPLESSLAESTTFIETSNLELMSSLLTCTVQHSGG